MTRYIYLSDLLKGSRVDLFHQVIGKLPMRITGLLEMRQIMNSFPQPSCSNRVIFRISDTAGHEHRLKLEWDEETNDVLVNFNPRKIRKIWL